MLYPLSYGGEPDSLQVADEAPPALKCACKEHLPWAILLAAAVPASTAPRS